MTSIPYSLENTHADINALIAKVAADAKLPLFDIAPRYLAALAKGPDMLNYRRYPLAKVPENLRPLATPYLLDPTSKEPTVVVLDNRLDGLLGHLPGWFKERVKAGTFLVLPIVHNGAVLGMLYGDQPDAGQIVINERALTLLKNLRNQVLHAMRQPPKA